MYDRCKVLIDKINQQNEEILRNEELSTSRGPLEVIRKRRTKTKNNNNNNNRERRQSNRNPDSLLSIFHTLFSSQENHANEIATTTTTTTTLIAEDWVNVSRRYGAVDSVGNTITRDESKTNQSSDRLLLLGVHNNSNNNDEFAPAPTTTTTLPEDFFAQAFPFFPIHDGIQTPATPATSVQVPLEEPNEEILPLELKDPRIRRCTTCEERAVCTVIIPCGHSIMCVTCSRKLVCGIPPTNLISQSSPETEATPKDTCPICCQKMKEILKIYQ